MARRSTRKSSGLSIDLSKVEGRALVPEGEHLAEVVEVTVEEGDKGQYLAWKFSTEDGTLHYNTSLVPKALWNLKSLLEALGAEIPDEAFDLNPADYVGMTCMVSVEFDTYNGKRQSKIVDFWEAEEETPKKGKGKKEDEDEKSARGRRSSKKDEEEEEEEKPARGRRRAAKDEEEEKPSRGRSKSKKSGISREDLDDMDEDGLEEVINEHDLDVDLSKYRTLRKMKVAVIDAAEEAGILED